MVRGSSGLELIRETFSKEERKQQRGNKIRTEGARDKMLAAPRLERGEGDERLKNLGEEKSLRQTSKETISGIPARGYPSE